jgi:hypothetical protein
MGQLDRAALLMSHSELHSTLVHNASLALTRAQQPYQLMPYETAEIQECSDTQAGALERGDESAAALCQWRS